MRCYISVVCALSVLVAVSYAAPATLDQLQTEEIAVNGQVSTQSISFHVILLLLTNDFILKV